MKFRERFNENGLNLKESESVILAEISYKIKNMHGDVKETSTIISYEAYLMGVSNKHNIKLIKTFSTSKPYDWNKIHRDAIYILEHNKPQKIYKDTHPVFMLGTSDLRSSKQVKIDNAELDKWVSSQKGIEKGSTQAILGDFLAKKGY